MIRSMCGVCQSVNVLQINEQIAAGNGLAAIGRQFKIPYHVVYNHAQNHLSRGLSKRSTDDQEKILDDMLVTKQRLEDMLLKAGEKGHTSIQLKIMSELRACNEQWIKITNNLEQARLHELEAMRLSQTPTEDKKAKDVQFQEKLSVLTFAEGCMLEKLSQKMESMDKSWIIIPDIDQFAKARFHRVNGQRVLDDEE
jgi:hypothetical protein